MPSHAAMKLLANRFANERYGHPLPTTATLQVTVRCQANCEHCSAARHRRAGTNELTTDQWKFIIRQCEDVGAATIVFTGGEPLLRQDIFELISSVREDEAVALMFSNGLLLTEENVRKLKDAGLDAIHVSIDSPNADINDALRRIPGCFDKAMAGLRRMKAAGIMTGISTYATPDSLRKGDVHRMIELAREAGCDELTISDLVPMGRLLKEDACLLLSDTDKDELCRIEEEQNAKNEPPHIITQGHINGTTGVGCFAGWSQLYITAYGDVTPCDFTPLRFGDCLREPLLDIWKRLAGHKAYVNRSRCCRMQDPVFRSKYIDSVPDRGPFPYPIELLGVEPRALAESRERKCSSLGVRG
jgi:MoaA/NifB/PqqE/SkfB family radical SAM enzyme